MNTKSYFYFLLCFAFFANPAMGQNPYQLGVMPVLNINKKLKKNIKLNFKSETREILYQEKNFDLKHDLVGFTAIISTKVALNNSLAGGFLLRLRDNKLSHRFIQQFTITQSKAIFRIGHRLSFDQTFVEKNAKYRFRYRLACQIPLNGRSVNSREFYLKLNNEYVNAFELGTYNLEIRFAFALGYEFNDNNKLEFGLENRSDSFIEEKLRNRSWIRLSWFTAL